MNSVPIQLVSRNIGLEIRSQAEAWLNQAVENQYVSLVQLTLLTVKAAF